MRELKMEPAPAFGDSTRVVCGEGSLREVIGFIELEYRTMRYCFSPNGPNIILEAAELRWLADVIDRKTGD